MSKLWKPSQYGVRAKETHWLNFTIAGHDLWCGCDTPLLHLLKAANERGGIFGLPQQQLEKLIKCLSSTEATGDHGDTTTEENTKDPEDDIINPGDLEKLFEEEDPFTEDSDG